MDFGRLLEPYAEIDPATRRPIRTIEGQMRWLARKGLPRNIIDQAVLKVFDEIERGKTFENGHLLDRYLLDVATELQQADLTKQAKALEEFMGKFKETWLEELKAAQKPGVWKRVKAVFAP